MIRALPLLVVCAACVAAPSAPRERPRPASPAQRAAAVRGVSPPQGAPDAASPPGPAPKAGPKLPDRADLERLLVETDAIAQTVSKIRGLALKRPLESGIMSRPQIEARVRLRLDEEYRPAEMLAEEQGLKRLGLLPPDVDYKEAVLALLTDQIAGFYDPKAKQLYVADWIEPEFQRMVMAHEIAHVLQDQHFDLQRFAPTNKTNADEQLARQAVIEGDGIAVMVEFMAREQGRTTDPWASPQEARALVKMMEHGEEGGLLGGAPLLLRESLIFPYATGLKVLAELRRTRPWSAINELYRRPPQSTEQVLHLDKWQRGEKPQVVPELKPPAGMRTLYANVFGELLTSVFLRQHGVRDARARAAAEGWGGDRLQVFAPRTAGTPLAADLVVVWRSSWDTDADAVEALEPFVEALGALVGPCTVTAEVGARCVGASGDLAVVERRGPRLVVIIGPVAIADGLRKPAWVGFAPRVTARERPPARP